MIAAGDGRQALVSALDRHRTILEQACAGLSPEQLRAAPYPPSPMSLLGLVRHVTDVERIWFRRRVAGEDVDPRYYSADDPDGDFRTEGADVAATFTAWHEERAATDAIVAATALDRTFPHRGVQSTVRWLLVHMVEEYARHNGHADLIRAAVLERGADQV